MASFGELKEKYLNEAGNFGYTISNKMKLKLLGWDILALGKNFIINGTDYKHQNYEKFRSEVEWVESLMDIKDKNKLHEFAFNVSKFDTNHISCEGKIGKVKISFIIGKWI